MNLARFSRPAAIMELASISLDTCRTKTGLVKTLRAKPTYHPTIVRVSITESLLLETIYFGKLYTCMYLHTPCPPFSVFEDISSHSKNVFVTLTYYLSFEMLHDSRCSVTF